MTVPSPIRNFLDIVRHGRVDNTYKMVWGKAIVELCVEDPGRTEIELEEIAEKVFASYWNLHIFFDPEGATLRQGSNSTKPPVILQLVLDSIKQYKESLREGFRPLFYEQAAPGDISLNTSKIVKVLKTDVSHRFLYLHDGVTNLYVYEEQANRISFHDGVCGEIADHSDILQESVSYRWTQILEDFNRTTPRIASKVRMQRDKNFRRKSLSGFHEWLMIGNEERICFQCGKKIMKDRGMAIDHMIPWSFLFSDDLWNLTYVHASCNSKKSNRAPKKKEVDALHVRNIELEELIGSRYSEKQRKKQFKDLKFANEHHLLRKMWTLYCNA